MRSTGRLQDRCHVNLAAKSNKMAGNSHGFEFSRTLSCAKAMKKNSHKEAQKALLECGGVLECANLLALWYGLSTNYYQSANKLAHSKERSISCRS